MKQKIGLETHVQLATPTKLFCSCPPGSTCPICRGFPGAKPFLSKSAVEKALQIAVALGCKIHEEMRFSRKSYFYPDLPKSFQITQYEEPLATEGKVEINGKIIRIRRVHLEEDPAKLEYEGSVSDAQFSWVDDRRSGTPLVEIVTEPDLSTPEEARAYLKHLFGLLTYLEVIDPNADGVMRTDANVSIEGGPRVEIKNITGFDAVEKAIRGELHRQFSLHNLGKPIRQETRLFDDERGVTLEARKKEGEEDYGYIYEPDLPPVAPRELLPSIKMKELPGHALARLQKQYGIPTQMARTIVYELGLLEFYEEAAKSYDAIKLAKWATGDLLKCLHFQEKSIKFILPSKFVEFLKLIDEGRRNERKAKEEIKRFVVDGEIRAKRQISDEELREAAKTISQKYGDKPIEFLIGELLKSLDYSVDPRKVRKFLEEARNK